MGKKLNWPTKIIVIVVTLIIYTISSSFFWGFVDKNSTLAVLAKLLQKVFTHRSVIEIFALFLMSLSISSFLVTIFGYRDTTLSIKNKISLLSFYTLSVFFTLFCFTYMSLGTLNAISLIVVATVGITKFCLNIYKKITK